MKTLKKIAGIFTTLLKLCLSPYAWFIAGLIWFAFFSSFPQVFKDLPIEQAKVVWRISACIIAYILFIVVAASITHLPAPPDLRSDEDKFYSS